MSVLYTIYSYVLIHTYLLMYNLLTFMSNNILQTYNIDNLISSELIKLESNFKLQQIKTRSFDLKQRRLIISIK